MNLIALGLWAFWTMIVVNITVDKARKAEDEKDMQTFKETPHKYKLKNIKEN